MRVLYIIEGLGTGGAERSLFEMLPGLAERGVEVSVAYFHIREQGLHERFLASPWLAATHHIPGGRAARVSRLRKLIKSTRPDVVHTTLFEADLAGRLASVRLGVPVLTSLVNDSYGRARRQDSRVPGWKLAFVRHADSQSAKRLNDHFHAISHSVKSAAIRDLKLAPESVTVVHRGRRLGSGGTDSGARESLRQEFRVGSDDILLVNVARREFQKGQDLLLAALAGLPSTLGWRCIVAGRDGAASVELLRLRERLGLEDRVSFLGHRTDVESLLVAGDIFVFPSRYEGLGGAVLEAMAAGLPVVASDLAVFREVLPDSQHRYLGDSHHALSGFVAELAGDPKLRMALGAANRMRVEDAFGLDQSVAGIADLYELVTTHLDAAVRHNLPRP
jgi:glycosyltransferase involved in cell wall biosynthesis